MACLRGGCSTRRRNHRRACVAEALRRAGPSRDVQRDDRAAGAVVSFIIAIAIFAVAFTMLTLFLTTVTTPDEGLTVTDLNARAASALEVLVRTAGIPDGWDQGHNARNLTRLGLVEAGAASRLDVDKIEALARASGTTDRTNDYVEFEEARDNLSLHGFDFHVRMQPVGRVDIGELRNMSVAYVGRYDQGPDKCEPFMNNVTLECYDSMNESASLKQLADTYGLQFRNVTYANFTPDADKYGDRYLELNKTAFTLRLGGWRAARPNATLNANSFAGWQLNDSYPGFDSRVGRFVTPSVWNASASRFQYDQVNQTICLLAVLVPDECDPPAGGTLGNYTNTTNLSFLRIMTPLIDLTNYTFANISFLHFADGHEAAGVALDYGVVQYADVTNESLDAWTNVSGDKFYRVGTKTSWDWSAMTLNLSLLNARKLYFSFLWTTDVTEDWDRWGWFLDGVRVSGVQGSSQTLLWTNYNEFNTSIYTTVIVGSSVKQSHLNQFKDVLDDWTRANGTLVGLGHVDLPNPVWFEDLVKAANSVSASGLFSTTSDLNHPILTIPNKLEIRDPSLARNYFTGPKHYDFAAAQAETFIKVLQIAVSGGCTDCESSLRVSKPNSLGNGTLILTSYTPQNFTNLTGRSDFFMNVILYSQFNRFYMDYGKSISSENVVGSAQRLALVPRAPGNPHLFEVQFTLYLWETDRKSSIRG